MKLFLSYNTKNRTFVDWAAGNLIQNGFEVFFDQYDLLPGDSWIREIEKGINDSEAALIFIGIEGIGEWQNKEALQIVNLRTKSNDYRLIPVVISQASGFVNYPLPWFLADYQWVEFKATGDNYAYSKLLQGLRAEKHMLTIGENPYKGLDSFGVKDAPHFFGRTFDVNLVFHNKLRLNVGILGNNFLAVVADSGTGKSSFMQAGILASLKNGRVAGSENWKQVILKPGVSPLTTLSSQLVIGGLIADRDSRELEENIKKYDDELLRKIRNQQQTWIIYIDQFEEVITQCKDEEERRAFLNNISRSIETEKCIILLSLRSDFYTAFAPYTLFKSILEKNNYTLSGIDALEKSHDDSDFTLREIILQPARNAGVEVQSNLVDTLINDVKLVKGKLPILELTLDLLWTNKNILDKITIDDYATISKNLNIKGIIASHADGVFNNITKNGNDNEKVELIKKIFVPYLIEISENGEDVRRTATKEELLKIKNDSNVSIETLLQELSNGRLLSIQETKDKKIKVEVVHEVIIREWPLLKTWIDKRRFAILYLERIEQDAKEYYDRTGELYSGSRLRKASKWKNKNEDLINYRVATFINQSKKNAKRKRVIPIIILVSLVLLIKFSAWYNNSVSKSELNEIIKNNLNLKIQLEAAGGRLDSIRYLVLNDKTYKLIQNYFRYFKRLRSLNLDGVDMKNFSSNGLNNLKALTFKNINSIGSVSLPASLTSLTISFNSRLTSLPNLENLQSLSSLIISNNLSLSSLPDLENLQSLSSLTISNNSRLTSLPNLEHLDLLSELELGKLEEQLMSSKIYTLKHLKMLIVSREYEIDYNKLNKNNSGLKLIKR